MLTKQIVVERWMAAGEPTMPVVSVYTEKLKQNTDIEIRIFFNKLFFFADWELFADELGS